MNEVFKDFGTMLNIILLLATGVLGALNVRNKYEKGKDDETLKTLKESNEAFATRRQADKIVIDAKDAEIKLLHQKAEVLEKHVTQAPDINKLATQMVRQHKEIMGAMGAMTMELGNVAKALSKDSK